MFENRPAGSTFLPVVCRAAWSRTNGVLLHSYECSLLLDSFDNCQLTGKTKNQEV